MTRHAPRFQRALITGAGAGIGRALAEKLLDEGTAVTAVDRSTPAWYAAHPAAERLVARTCDLAEGAALDRLLGELAQEAPFDLVIHNAGVSATGRFETIPDEAYVRLLMVNARAPMILAADMMQRGLYARNARLVFIASLSHATSYPGAAVYAASKDAIAVYARSIRRPFARRGVTVTCVFPGPTRTEHAARHAPAGAKEQARMPPAELAARILRAAAAGRAVLYPGMLAGVTRLASALAPRAVERLMRRLIFEKLDRSVW